MPSKQHIIDNAPDYKVTELADFVRQGLVTYDELCTNIDWPHSDRHELAALLRSAPAAPAPTAAEDADEETRAFREAREAGTREAMLAFIRRDPLGRYADEARALLQQMTAAASAPQPQNIDSVGTRHVASAPINQQTSAPTPSSSVWDAVDKTSAEALRDFIRNNSTDVAHCREARRLLHSLDADPELRPKRDIVKLIKEVADIGTNKNVLNPNLKIYQTITDYIDKGDATTTDILNVIRDDHNWLGSTVIKKLLDEFYISDEELAACGIDKRFIAFLYEDHTDEDINKQGRIDKIEKECTEIYFWGIPSSGKTCALGAILSVANNGTIARTMEKNNCQGYGYMTRLANMFRSTGNVGTLPPGTPTVATYEMGFDLISHNNRLHPITCIDLAGELTRIMYKKKAGDDLKEDEEEVLATVTRLLGDNRSRNRKMHFFVLEYGGEKRTYEGLRQEEYLKAALDYIKETGIFKEDTDAIFLMFTKVDKLGLEGQPLIDALVDYTDRNYKGFYEGLKSICERAEINGCKVTRLPFTLGDVCFQDFCLFNGEAAELVLKELLNHTWSTDISKRGRIMKLFKK